MSRCLRLSSSLVLPSRSCTCLLFFNPHSFSSQTISLSRRHQSNGISKDFYAVLDVKPTATEKEIKVAFYKKSKEYHPDTNPDDASDAAKKFHQITEAYDILGSKEKRKLYDMNKKRSIEELKMHAQYTQTPSQRGPQYEDLDFTYRQFEIFQENARRKRRQTSKANQDQAAREFYEKFGGRPVFKNEYDEMYHEFLHRTRDLEREAELLREIEKEKEEHQRKYPMPEFEKIRRQKKAKETKENLGIIVGLMGMATAGGTIYYLTSFK